MEMIMYEGKCDFADYVKIVYKIENDSLTMTQYTYSKKNLKRLFKQDDCENKIILTIDKWFTKKLLNIISENELKEKFGNQNGFTSFQDFCEKKKIEMHFSMAFD